MGTINYEDCWTYPLPYLKKALGELDAAIDALDTRVTELETAAKGTNTAATKKGETK